jgi:hypothetical protein
MNWISKIWSFLINPKNTRMLILAVLVSFGVLFLKQCNNIKGLKEDIKTEQAESSRIENNFNVSQDSINYFKTKNGSMQAEINSYILSENELDSKYSLLFANYEKEKDKKPITIIEYLIKIKDSIKEIPIYISTDSLGNNSFVFNDSSDYENGNKRWFSGKLTYNLNYYNLPDSTLMYSNKLNYANVIPGLGNFSLIQNITLTTGLSIDNKTKKPIIWVKTKYPGVTFPLIKGTQITEDPISSKAARSLRKEFGIGLFTGVGYNLSNTDSSPGFIIGAGLTYTPKWLQFGK